MAIRLLSGAEVDYLRGGSRSGRYLDIDNGLFVPPVRVGQRAAKFPEHEVEAIIAVHVAGGSDDQVRELVRQLLHARKHAYRLVAAPDQVRELVQGLVAACLERVTPRRDGDTNCNEAAGFLEGAAR